MADQDKRAQRGEATKRALLTAAVAATIERNGEIPSVETLCAKAGFSRGAFYVHFRDRDHFVAEMLEWILSDILQKILETTTAGTSTIQEVAERFTVMFAGRNWPDVQAGITPVYLAVLREIKPGSSLRTRHAALLNSIVERLETLIAAGRDAGAVRPDVDPRSVASICLLASVGAVMWSDVASPDDVNRAASSLIASMGIA